MSDRILVVCGECTGKLAVPLTAAGKKIRCPRCSSVVAVPAAQAGSSTAPAAVGTSATVRKARRVSTEDNPSSDNTMPEAKPRPRQKPKHAPPAADSWNTDGLSSYGDGNDDWETYDEPEGTASAMPPRSQRGNRQAGRSASQAIAAGKETSAARGPMLTGILMMVGALVWFFGGLAAGIIFYYPPILFILGLVSFFKGMFGSSSS